MEKSLLVVDDSRVSRMMIISFVKACDDSWKIFEAGNCDEAIEQAKGHDITAVSLDLNMPGRNGLEIVEELKEIHPKIKISLFTANIQKSVVSNAEELGISFIAKPVTEAKVVDLITGINASL